MRTAAATPEVTAGTTLRRQRTESLCIEVLTLSIVAIGIEVFVRVGINAIEHKAYSSGSAELQYRGEAGENSAGCLACANNSERGIELLREDSRFSDQKDWRTEIGRASCRERG